jgi:hypothetical protein
MISSFGIRSIIEPSMRRVPPAARPRMRGPVSRNTSSRLSACQPRCTVKRCPMPSTMRGIMALGMKMSTVLNG